jgi:hypothetical protein
MRKKKENLAYNAKRDPMIPETDALESEREQRMEEIGGESSTEGLGPGFDSGLDEPEGFESADGPLSGDSMEPPTGRRGHAKKRRKGQHPEEWRNKGNHIAARSSKKI